MFKTHKKIKLKGTNLKTNLTTTTSCGLFEESNATAPLILPTRRPRGYHTAADTSHFLPSQLTGMGWGAKIKYFDLLNSYF